MTCTPACRQASRSGSERRSGTRQLWAPGRAGFVGDPGEERFLAIVTKQPLELVDGMPAKLKEQTIPTVNTSAKEFGTWGVVPKVKKLKATDWGVGQTFFFREK